MELREVLWQNCQMEEMMWRWEESRMLHRLGFEEV